MSLQVEIGHRKHVTGKMSLTRIYKDDAMKFTADVQT